MRSSLFCSVIAATIALCSCRETPASTDLNAAQTAGGAALANVPTTTPDAAPEPSDAAAPLAAAAPAAQPELSAASAIRWPTIHRSSLSNGVSVAFVEHRTLPVLHVRVILRGAGALFDPPARPGLAAVMGELLREGVQGMDSRAIAAAFDGAGARLSTDTGDDALTLSLDTLPERAEQTLALVAKLLSEPTFPRDELDRLKRRELDRLAQEMAEPAWLSQRPFYRAIYGEAHPYSRFDTSPEALSAITRDEVAAFHRDHVKGGSITVVAVGAVAPDAFAQLAQRAFAPIAQGTVARPQMPAIPARAARQVFIVDRPASAQAFVRVGRVGPRRSDPVWPALAVANQVLGAAPSSRLFVDLRERRSLTYGVYSRVSAAVDEGVVAASGSTRLERAGDFARGLIEHLDRMATESVPEDELARAQRVVQNRFPVSFATANDLAARVSESVLYGLDQSYFEGYPARAAAVTSGAVLEVGQRFFATSAAVIVVVGPARRLQPVLRELGPITVLRPGQ
jgi:zinc protease